MAWFLIVLGFILIMSGIYGRYRQYIDNFEEKKGIFDNKEDLFENQQNKLIEVSRELDLLIASINKKERELAAAVKDLNLDRLTDKAGVPEKENNFRQILNHSYSKTSESGSMPEKYNRVFALAEKNLEAEEIAKKLDLGIRETELILRLYRNGVDTFVR